MLITVETDDLASAADLSRELGVTRATVSNWVQRYPDFPKPVFAAIYQRSEVLDWFDTRQADMEARKSARRCCDHECQGHGGDLL